MTEKFKNLLGDLGKPTLRGIRKCPKCGTYNGTRGMVCKNKSCNAIFKEAKEKDRTLGQAVKITTGSDMQIFSVKIHERNPEIWGFVQLPVIEELNFLQITPEVEILLQSAAQCFVDNCQKSNEEILELSITIPTCPHVKSALSASREAKPLTFKKSLINSLSVSTEMKAELWKLTEKTGPLVQRLSKNCMVVKCLDDNIYRSGFVHVYFCNLNSKESPVKYRIICDCSPIGPKKSKFSKSESWCVHCYACVCAFASDKQLSKEFKCLLLMANLEKSVPNNLYNNILKRKIAIMEAEKKGFEESEQILIPDSQECFPITKKRNSLEKGNSGVFIVPDNISNTVTLDDTFSKSLSEAALKKNATVHIDESSVNMSFQFWLASVTERINQAMHYQFNGKPDPLVFHVPQMFFDCLQQRIPGGSKRKKPFSTCTFERKNAVPLGKFTKYVWHLYNLVDIKQIFDTPKMPLEFSKSFVHNHDGTYDIYEKSLEGEELEEYFKKTNNKPLIKPLELKTFLKVGRTAEEDTPFVIEWIPDILPKSNIGELHIKFEFGHIRNGKSGLC